MEENLKKMADNSKDEARAGITNAILQKGPVFVAKTRSFSQRYIPDGNWTKQNIYQKSVNAQKTTSHSERLLNIIFEKKKPLQIN